jgi:hypothetical protein
VVSPLLANIYLDRLDKFVEGTLIPEHTKGNYRRQKPEYRKIIKLIGRLKKKGAKDETLRPYRKAARKIGARDPLDPGYRRLRYIRYADDCAPRRCERATFRSVLERHAA